MAEHFAHPGFDELRALADERSELLEKLDDGEAVETLFAFAMAEGAVRPSETESRLSVSADKKTDSIVVEVALPGVRQEEETLSLSEALDWETAPMSADAYARALTAALDAANGVEPRSRLP